MHRLISRTKKECQKLQDLLTLGLQGPPLVSLLNRATGEHHQIEDLFAKRIQQGRCGCRAVFPYRRLSGQRYFERNFFSILFLSLFIALDIPKVRRLRYGVILHCLRTVVTSADNILDGEQKGAVVLEENRSNPVLKNILLTLMSQMIISQTVREIVDNGEEAKWIETRLLDCLDSVAAGESVTSMRGRDRIASPEELIRAVHEKIGGELLRLALVVPIENETTLREPMRLAEKGILAIGVALQMLDDVVDLEEDLRAEKTNLLASWIIHHTQEITWPQLRELETGGCFPTHRYESLRMEVINQAIEKALEGFGYLTQSGYPVKRNQAISVLKIMFRLRGLENEWNKSAYS